MAKPKIPNQKKKYIAHQQRIESYISLLSQVYNTLNAEVAKLVTRIGYDGEKEFKFSDYPQTRKAINDLQAQFVNEIHSVIYRGTSDEWKNSNEVQDLLTDKVLKAYTATVDKKKYKVLYQTNSDVLKAFQNRKDKGFNISAKLWQQAAIYKDEMEATISCAIQKGTSAITLSKQISKYLRDFPKLRKDYTSKFGKATDILDCEYRSARLARTEINMAYRTAEQTRWSQMDFVVGYEVKRSGKEFPCKVCEALAGKYPKTFKFVGWHPNCMCYVIPILKTEEEFWAWDGRSEASTDSVNEIKDVPDGFKQWAGANSQRIEDAKNRGTLPYFIKDNKKTLDEILSGSPIREYYAPIGTDTKKKALWSESAIGTEKKLGIKFGSPMTFEEANELRGNINYSRGDEYRVNCQSCVVANELRRRGMDVTAMPNLKTEGNIPYELSLKTNSAWIDPKTGEMPGKIVIGRTVNNKGSIVAKPMKETLHDLYEATKEPGRYHINWGWKHKNEGHIVTFERTPSGKVIWYDPQTGKKDFFNKNYYDSMRVSSGIHILRVDNMLVNNEIIEDVVAKIKE